MTDAYLGSFLQTYLAHAADPAVRSRGSSGGVITALLTGLLDDGSVDGALVTSMDQEKPYLAQAALATTRQELLSAAGSKYQPVDTSSLLPSLSHEHRYAVVDKQCGLSRMRAALKRLPESERPMIAYELGIFCGFEMSPAGTDFLLDSLHIDRSMIQQMGYREGPWPGGFQVSTKDGRQYFVSKEDYSLLAYLYTEPRCLYCEDQTNEIADISFGDAWMVSPEQGGFTAVITRTERGETLMQKAVEQGWIQAETIDSEAIKRSHSFLCRYKKVGGRIRRNRAKHRPLLEGLDSVETSVTRQEILKQLFFAALFHFRRPFLFLFRVLPFSFFKWVSRSLRRGMIYRNVRKTFP